MKREIGSFFWEYQLNNSNKNIDIFNKLGTDKLLLSSGRDSLKLFIKEVGVNKKIILPGFTCESVVKPFIDKGYEIYFYNINSNLEIDNTLFFKKIKEIKPDVILVHSYFGFNTLKNIKDSLLKLKKESEVIILEDITHCMYSNFNFINSDYTVASLRKWFAVPEGGLIAKREGELNKNFISKESSVIYDELIDVYKIKESYMENGKIELKNDFLSRFNKCELSFNEDKEVRYMYSKAIDIYNNTDIKKLSKKRIKNYLYLLENLKEIEGIEILFENLGQDIVPLYFPIYIKENKREKFRKKMAENNIYCPIIWPISDYVKDKIDEETLKIYDEILCIPCDQRYDREEIEKILKTIKSIMKNL